jgi:hypothetical protein
MALQPRSQQALDVFVGAANPGGLHPNDSERWNAFIIAVRLDGLGVKDVHGEVRRRLVEAGFPEDRSEGEAIDDLLGRLQDGLWLLDMWEQDRIGPADVR